MINIPPLTMPDGYFERAREGITRIIEHNWDGWTISKRRYLLVSLHCVVEGDVTKRTGAVTDRMEFHVTSDNVECLRQLWKTSWFQQGFDTTVTHFIVDTQDRKVIDLLSICA